jgi:hypothetical protein
MCGGESMGMVGCLKGEEGGVEWWWRRVDGC